MSNQHAYSTSYPTAPAERSAGWELFDRALRWMTMALIFAIVAGALAGVGGMRTGEAAAEGEAIAVTVTYAETTRPGLSTPFRVEVSAIENESLPSEIEVSITDDYLSMFDENGLYPEPESTHFDGDTLVWTYQLDGEPTLVIDFDARLQPNVHRGRDASVIVSAADIKPVTVGFHTTVFG